MAQTERPLIEVARDSLVQREADRIQQQEADQICAQIHLIAEGLLNGNGVVRRSIGMRIQYGLLFITGIGIPIIALVEVATRKWGGGHAWESDDWVKWQTRLNGSEPLVSVWLQSQGIEPRKAISISVRVDGLPESLVLFRDQGNIHHPYEIPSEHAGAFLRRANLADAQRWQQLITSLHDQ